MTVPNEPGCRERTASRASLLAIELPDSLAALARADAIDGQSLESRISGALASGCEELQLPLPFRVDLVTGRIPAPKSEFPLRIRINSLEARYSPELLSIVQGYCAGAVADCEMRGDTLTRWLADAAAKRAPLAAEFVSFATLEIVKRNVHLLIGNDLLCACSEIVFGAERSLTPQAEVRLRWALQTLVVCGLRISPVQELWDAAGHASEREFRARFENLLETRRQDAVELRLPTEYLREITENEAGSWRLSLNAVLASMEVETGVPVPPLRIVVDHTLRPRSFRFKINDTFGPSFHGLVTEQLLVNNTASNVKYLAGEARPALNPGAGYDAAVVATTSRAKLEATGHTCWTGFGYIGLALSEALRRRSYWFLDLAVVKRLMTEAGASSPRIVEVVDSLLSREELTGLVRELAAEQVPMRNLRMLCEAIADAAYSDAADLVSAVRAGLRREITGRHTRQAVLVAYLIDDSVLRALEGGPGDTEARQVRVLDAIRAELEHLPRTTTPPVLLTTGAARAKVRRVVQEEFPRLTVIAFDELDPEVSVQAIARIAL